MLQKINVDINNNREMINNDWLLLIGLHYIIIIALLILKHLYREVFKMF